MNTRKMASGREEIGVRPLTSRDERLHFEVVVRDQGGETTYQVTMCHADFKRLAEKNTAPEDCVRAAFLFLLDREPKGSILRRFDISVIEHYFPEFRREFPRYLDAACPGGS